MLGSHPAVHTVAEPWIMLPPVYALRDEGVEAAYDNRLARKGQSAFLDKLPNGQDDYEEGLSRMFGFVYRQALSETKCSIFLDKTPRYYLILEELSRIFSEARFILLFRNPLAVLSSVLDTWVAPNWLRLASFKKEKDLLEAPQLLVEGKTNLGEKAHCIRYEELVREPEKEMRDICDHVGIDHDENIVEYGGGDGGDWELGDPETVHQKSKPTTSSIEKWKERCHHPQYWRLMHDYLEILDARRLRKMGYQKERMVSELHDRRPAQSKLRMTFSLEWILRAPPGKRSRWEREFVRQTENVRRGGLSRVFSSFFSRSYDKLSQA